MSVNYYTKVGPYIKVYNPEQDSMEEYHSCSNTKCQSHGQKFSEKFCYRCGKEIKLLSFKCRKSIEIDVYEEFEDKLSEVCTEGKPHKQENYLFFVPNQGKHGIILDGEDTSEVEIDETTLMDQCIRFGSCYTKEKTRLREIFGEKTYP